MLLQRASCPPRPRTCRARRITCVAAPPQSDVRVWRRPNTPRVLAPTGYGTLLILPGFGNASEDYTSPFGQEEASLASALRRRGFTVDVLPVERRDWFNVAKALFSPNFYSGRCTASEGYRWYLDRVALAVQRRESAGQRVTLVGHSAGGWLARAFLGDEIYCVAGGPRPAVRALVSLGTPHAPPPDGVADVTRGCLTWLEETYPGAFYHPGVRYVSVAGNTVAGRTGEARDEAGQRRPPAYAASSYSTLLGGDGDGVEGDAVVPTSCALLPGSVQVVLPGVWHSVSRVGTFSEDAGLAWYGTDSVVDAWLEPMTTL